MTVCTLEPELPGSFTTWGQTPLMTLLTSEKIECSNEVNTLTARVRSVRFSPVVVAAVSSPDTGTPLLPTASPHPGSSLWSWVGLQSSPSSGGDGGAPTGAEQELPHCPLLLVSTPDRFFSSLIHFLCAPASVNNPSLCPCTTLTWAVKYPKGQTSQPGTLDAKRFCFVLFCLSYIRTNQFNFKGHFGILQPGIRVHSDYSVFVSHTISIYQTPAM